MIASLWALLCQHIRLPCGACCHPCLVWSRTGIRQTRGSFVTSAELQWFELSRTDLRYAGQPCWRASRRAAPLWQGWTTWTERSGRHDGAQLRRASESVYLQQTEFLAKASQGRKVLLFTTSEDFSPCCLHSSLYHPGQCQSAFVAITSVARR